MKKIISITISNQVFNIEEDAYQVLDTYLKDLRGHYENTTEANEILSDIESSIAEKFSQKTTGPINLDDVHNIIKVMGKPEEIAGEEKKQESGEKGKRRFYRNPDDVIIAGVASGIAAYFDIDPLIVRIIFIVFTLLNGVGILIYIILWIVVPSADSSSQKLEMKGKKVNINEIHESFKKKFENKNTSSFYRVVNAPIKIAGSIFSAIKKIIKALLPVLAMIIGSIFVAAGIAAIAGLTIASTVALFNINSPYIISDFPLAEIAAQPLYYPGVIAAVVAVMIPIIFLITVGVSLFKRKNAFRTTPTVIMLIAFVFAVAVGAAAASRIAPWVQERAGQYQDTNTVSQTFQAAYFNKIQNSNNISLSIRQGETYSVALRGAKEALNRTRVEVLNNELTITTSPRNKICIFCWHKKISGEITLPTLSRYRGSDISTADIQNLPSINEIVLSDAAQATTTINTGTFTASLSDISSLTATGTATSVDISTSDASKAHFEDVSLDKAEIHASDISKIYIKPQTISGKIKDISRVILYITPKTNTIQTEDVAKVISNSQIE